MLYAYTVRFDVTENKADAASPGAAEVAVELAAFACPRATPRRQP